AASPSVVAPPVQNKVQDTSSSSNAAAVNRAFPDGEIDCSTFPSDYGAVPVDWLNLGGWASVQKPNVVEVSGFNDILTVTKNECQGDNCCLEGAFCSYACPEGYMKYQWPSTQGATGQSVGGLQCKNGKLHLTNPSINTLCATGTNNVNVWIENRLSKNVAICRTNYPGDENMSIPVDAQPGSKKKLACPDSATYYRWQNKGTSAQYYLNLPGYSVDKACRWGKPGDDFGNWAPANLGVGWTDGRAWLSVFANHPTQTQVTLPYTVEIVGGNTKCRYKNGQYCGGDNYSTCSTEG
ncbi:SUN-domain-containing protein, partial [Trichodelitschia bisporula]